MLPVPYHRALTLPTWILSVRFESGVRPRAQRATRATEPCVARAVERYAQEPGEAFGPSRRGTYGQRWVSWLKSGITPHAQRAEAVSWGVMPKWWSSDNDLFPLLPLAADRALMA
jgi:hypothetical protein